MIVSILIIYLFATLMQYGPESAYGGTELKFSEGKKKKKKNSVRESLCMCGGEMGNVGR